MLRYMRWVLPLVTVAVLPLGACTASSESASGGGNSGCAAATKADEALAGLRDKVLSNGPGGESPAKAETVSLSEADITKVKSMNATAAIVMHYGGNDWANAQIAGLKEQFGRLGINVVAVTDANFKPDKQVSDIETVMSKKPSIIVSIPTDPVATASAYKKAADAGIKLVFMDNVPQGMTAGKDYVSVVSADNYGNGVVSAHLLAKSLCGEGNVGVIFHEADFFVTRQRYDGFKKTIADSYPDIEIVESKGIAGPDFAGDAQAAANAMLSQHPDLAGIWGVWDVPAEGIMAAARASGRTDLKIATQDLGKNVAIALAKDQLVVGLGAQRPFDQGVAEAAAGATALLGRRAAPYIALSALPVTHANVLQAWQEVYHVSAPADLSGSYKN
jgi:ribose transport system substrate-binding protein